MWGTRRGRTVLLILPGVLALGCHPPPPTPTPLLGCYAVEVSGWSDTYRQATGLEELPRVIAVEDRADRWLRVPPAWRLEAPEYRNVAYWGDRVSGDVYMTDTSIIVSRGTPRRLAGDSLLVSFGSWGGGATAWLAPSERGYSGWLLVAPYWQRSEPWARLTLARTDCRDHVLTSSAPENVP